jgi:acylphosphatase/DNA-binding transcriptional MerR regulator
MKRIYALISGEVQGVGYREEIKRIAFELNIYGWVRNLEDGRVEITAEGEDRSFEEFLEKINIKRYPIFVEVVEAKEEIYKGDLKSFKVVRDKDLQKEILSALSRGTVDIHEVKEILRDVRQDTAHIPEIRENTKIMLEKQDKMLEKQDKMLEKQDTLLSVTENGFKELKEEMHIIRQNTSLIPAMRDDTASIRTDTREIATRLGEKYEELSKEIAQMKITLSKIEAKVFS